MIFNKINWCVANHIFAERVFLIGTETQFVQIKDLILLTIEKVLNQKPK